MRDFNFCNDKLCFSQENTILARRMTEMPTDIQVFISFSHEKQFSLEENRNAERDPTFYNEKLCFPARNTVSRTRSQILQRETGFPGEKHSFSNEIQNLVTRNRVSRTRIYSR